MKTGDLVKMKSILRAGLIVNQEPNNAIGLKVFMVLCQDGKVRRKTCAAIEKVISESR